LVSTVEAFRALTLIAGGGGPTDRCLAAAHRLSDNNGHEQ
jgi:hypothetical protein